MQEATLMNDDISIFHNINHANTPNFDENKLKQIKNTLRMYLLRSVSNEIDLTLHIKSNNGFLTQSILKPENASLSLIVIT